MLAICSKRDKLISVTPVSIFENAGIEIPRRLATSSWLQPRWCRIVLIFLPTVLSVFFFKLSVIIIVLSGYLVFKSGKFTIHGYKPNASLINGQNTVAKQLINIISSK